MNVKRWLLASLAVLVVIAVLEFVVNNVLLRGIYEQTASVWRPMPEIRSRIWLFWVVYLVFAPVFGFIYTQGYEPAKSGLAQGLRFGLYIGLLLAPVTSLGWYAVLPIPASLVAYWFVGTLVECLAAGAAAGLIYRTE